MAGCDAAHSHAVCYVHLVHEQVRAGLGNETLENIVQYLIHKQAHCEGQRPEVPS